MANAQQQRQDPPDPVDMEGISLGTAGLASRVLEETGVEACVVLVRKNAENGARERVVYVVPVAAGHPDRIGTTIRACLPEDNVPSFWVLVTAFPLDDRGEIDVEALRRIPVLESSLMQRWESRVREQPGVRVAAVVVQEPLPAEELVHLSDLLPGWVRGGAESSREGPAFASLTDRKPAAPTASFPPAYASGGPLAVPENAPQTLTDALLETARTSSQKGIVYVAANGRETYQSYPQLLEEARRALSGLLDAGLKPGDRAVLQAPSLPDHFVAFWACVLGGITPVTVAVAPSYREPNAVVHKLHNIWKLLERPPILTGDALADRLDGLKDLFSGEPFRILSVDEAKRCAPAEVLHPAQPDDVLFFQLTSGSTGVPKCIQESHRSIIAHIHGSQQFNGYTPDNVCLNWLPLDHVVPILTCHLKDVYLGCGEVQVETARVLVDPLCWFDLLEAHRVTHTWAPNFGFKLVADRLASAGDRTWDLSAMTSFMNAGEQVTLPVVQDFLERAAPFGVRTRAMQPAFGMAEVCTCMTYQNNFDFEAGVHWFRKAASGRPLEAGAEGDAGTVAFVDLGPPIPGVEIRIADKHNRVLPERTIGRLQIKGSVLTRGYLHNDEANRESFVGDGWFNSGDLGFMLNGRLTLTGREKEMIVMRGANFYCYEIEDVVNGLPGVEPTFTGSCAVQDPATGTEGLAIFFVPRDESPDAWGGVVRCIRTEVTAQLGISPTFVLPLSHSAFPKTTSGKIQRRQLRQSLEAGRYDDLVKEMDLALGNANTLPNWFYRKIWRRKEPGCSASAPEPGAVLVFADRKGLVDHLGEALAPEIPVWVRIERGQDFARVDATHYHIHPAEPDHYRRLAASLAADGIRAGRVVHLWTYRDPDADLHGPSALGRTFDGGLYSLLFLGRALSDLDPAERPERLLAVSSHSQRVQEGDRIDCARSAMLGLLSTMGQEMPWLTCGHVDLPGRDAHREAEYVLSELRCTAADVYAAWREGARWVPRLQAVDFGPEQPPGPLPFRDGSFYVISGGLGGIGAQVARYLLTRHRARLLLLGRTRLDALEGGVVAPERLRVLRELQQIGEVRYEALDVADTEALQEALDRTRAAWACDPAGAIHLAGLYRERPLRETTREEAEEVLRPKVQGALALLRMLASYPGSLFVTFSSVNGFLGAYSAGVYAAANAFLDGLAEHLRDGALRHFNLAWSLWDEVGMSRGFAMKELARNRGYCALQPEQSLHSFLAALCRDDSQLFIGLDGTRPSLRPFLENGVAPLQTLCVFLESEDSDVLRASLRRLIVLDRYGTPTRCRYERMGHLPLTDRGEVDRRRLSRAERGGGEPPATPVEEALAAIWSDVLGIGNVNRDDNFFNRGGHSLLAVQMAFRIDETFKVPFPLTALLEVPLLSAMAQRIEAQILERAAPADMEALLAEIEQGGN